jgi:hypothetical protein
MHIEEDSSFRSDILDSAFAPYSSSNGNGSDVFQRFAGTHPGYPQYDVMDDLAQKIDPIQRNNIEFENLDDVLLDSDFILIEQQQSSEADDMFLHDADLMMWDETMDVLADASGDSPDTFTMDTSGLLLCVPGQNSCGNELNYENDHLNTTTVDSSPIGMMSSTNNSSSQTAKKSTPSRSKHARTPPAQDAMTGNNSQRKKQPNNSNPAQAQLLNSSTNNALSRKEEKALARGNYRCGRCGLPKVNHVCQYVDAVGTNVSIQVSAPIIQVDKGIPFAGERFLSVSSSSSGNRALPPLPPPIAESPRSLGGISRSSMDVDDASSILSFGPPPTLQQQSVPLETSNAISNKHLPMSSYNIDVFYEEDDEDADDGNANTTNNTSISPDGSGDGVLLSDEQRYIHNHMGDNPMLLMLPHHRHPNENDNKRNYYNDQTAVMTEGMSSSDMSNNHKAGGEDDQQVIDTYINNRAYIQQQYVNRQHQQQSSSSSSRNPDDDPEIVQASEASTNNNSSNDSTTSKPSRSSFAPFLCTVNNDQADATCVFPFFCF